VTDTDISLPRGIRDIEPEEFRLQAKVRAAFEEVARLYNFRVMEPASIEHLVTLRAKSGEDVDKQIYTFKDKGGRDVGLRFDLTVGITRYVCSRKDLRLPAKVAAFGGMWRYEEPQYGRFRWSHQWDLEIFGPPGVDSDAEVIEASAAILKRVGLERATLKIGDRRVVEGFIRGQMGIASEERVVELMRALDKVETKTRKELEQEYVAKGFTMEELGRVLDLGAVGGRPDDVLKRASEMRLASMADLERLHDILNSRGVKNVEYCLRIVRGIDYYTGVVFEAVDPANPKLGSLCGGGRYDALPRVFGRPDLTATGAAGGVEREAMSISEGRSPGSVTAFVTYASPKTYGDALSILSRLRSEGLACDVSPLGRSLGKQLEDAAAAGARWAFILGPREAASGLVTLRDMNSRNEDRVPFDEALKRVLAS
jgi:histidyl-tRNA synthetase